MQPLLSIFNDGALDLTPHQYAGLGIIALCAVAAQAVYLMAAILFIRSHNHPTRRAYWRRERRRLDGVVFGLLIAASILIGVRFLDLDPNLRDTVEIAARVLGAVCAGLLLLRGIAIIVPSSCAWCGSRAHMPRLANFGRCSVTSPRSASMASNGS